MKRRKKNKEIGGGILKAPAAMKVEEKKEEKVEKREIKRKIISC